MFKVGQKVVCVREGQTKATKVGEIYTIELLFEWYGIPACLLKEVETHLPGFDLSRFRPIDYTFGEKLAEEIQEEINQEQLVNA